jgi:hypothetical protein
MNIISHSQSTFLDYCNALESLFTKSTKQKNPALWLYNNNARTTLFMLEALSRMFKTFHNKKRFTKMFDFFKRLEDGLGAIDHSIAMQTYCKQNKNVPKEIAICFKEDVENNLDALNIYLSDNFFASNKGFEEIKEKIASADWMEEEEETKAIHQYYLNQIEKLNIWIKEIDGNFTDIENHIHELRRKIRWLSILPQALQGKIQLKAVATKDVKYKKYATKEVTSSPFNKIPLKGNLKSIVLLNKNAYYSLSWLILELGKLKDQGLTQHGLAAAFGNVHLGKELEAAKITAGYAKNYLPDEQIVLQANKIVDTYFKEKMLEDLLNF